MQPTSTASNDALTMLFAAHADRDPLRIAAAMRALEFAEAMRGLALVPPRSSEEQR